MKHLLTFLIPIIAISCTSTEQQDAVEPALVQVELTTSKGIILLELSDKTPLHRDNFNKIVNEGRLDSMLFHRVLDGFVVQAGEYDSLKIAMMDSLELEETNYRIPAELDTALFHKRGALGAARTNNPDRESSSLSFYFVQRGPRLDSLIDIDEERINGWLKEHYFLNSADNRIWKDSLINVEEMGDWNLFYSIYDTIRSMAESYEIKPYLIPEYQREVYRTLGGTPHLDQNYTVFGEVINGMSVVDSIAAVAVNEAGRPDQNVYILSARIIEKD